MNARIKTNKKEKISRIGFIKVGEKYKNKNGNEVPRSLDYFIADGDYAEHFRQIYPGKPNNIKIMFISDNIEDVCDERLEIWQGKKRFGRGDGETFEVYNPKTDKYEERKPDDVDKFLNDVQVYVNRGQKYKAEWKHTLTLRFLIPEIGGILGVWELSTRGSESSIPNIVSMFDRVMTIGDTVTRTIFDLRVEMAKSVKPGSTSRYPVISIVPNMSQNNLDKMKKCLDNGIEIPMIVHESDIKEIDYQKTS